MIVKIDMELELKRVEQVFRDKRRRIEESKNRHLNIKRRKGKR